MTRWKYCQLTLYTDAGGQDFFQVIYPREPMSGGPVHYKFPMTPPPPEWEAGSDERTKITLYNLSAALAVLGENEWEAYQVNEANTCWHFKKAHVTEF